MHAHTRTHARTHTHTHTRTRTLGAAASSDAVLPQAVPLAGALRALLHDAEPKASDAALAAELSGRLARFAARPLRRCLRAACEDPDGAAARLDELARAAVGAAAPAGLQDAAASLRALCASGGDGAGGDGYVRAARMLAPDYALAVALVRRFGSGAAAWAAVRAALDEASGKRSLVRRARRDAALRAHSTARSEQSGGQKTLWLHDEPAN